MKISTVLSYDFTDEERRLINAYYRMPGLATSEMLEEMMEDHGLPRKGEGWFVIFLEGKQHGENSECEIMTESLSDA